MDTVEHRNMRIMSDVQIVWRGSAGDHIVTQILSFLGFV